MPWTAPPVEIPVPPRPAPERSSLDGFLDRHRALLLHRCAGLTGDQLACRPIASSTLSLLGLVRHLTEVERIWFRTRFAGEPFEAVYQTEENPGAAFDEARPDGAEKDFAAFAGEIAIIRPLVAGRSLDEEAVFGRDRRVTDLRWVYQHMIEEYAQHNGHADLLRELIDGTTG